MYSLVRLPYSIRDSFWSVDQDNNIITLNCLRVELVTRFFEIETDKNANVHFNPWECTIENEKSTINLLLYGEDSFFIRGKGAPMTLKCINSFIGFGYAISENGGIKISHAKKYAYEWIYPIKGKLDINVERGTGFRSDRCEKMEIVLYPDENDEYEVSVEGFISDGLPTIFKKGYDVCLQEVKKDYLQWEENFGCKDDYDRECAYILWENILPKSGNFYTEGIVMSKAGMCAIWSWDNLFNAWALSDIDDKMAFDQFTILLKHMNEYGKVPDSISEETVYWQFVKPPIYGWVYNKMIEKNPVFAEDKYLIPTYEYIKKSTEWWLKWRGENPCYFHGNDCGADNSTVFDHSFHMETGELFAFLSIQCRFVADVAKKLGHIDEAEEFEIKERLLREKAIKDYWDGNKIFAFSVDDKTRVYSKSLLPLRVVTLGKLLPKEIAEYIATEIKNNYLGVGGVASEAYTSEKFDRDGYWRGAVWAPEQLMIYEGLKDCGFVELANEVAHNYVTSIKKFGFYENTDLLTGSGLKCKGYAWSTNAYMILKNILNS